jgi:glutamine synthetase
LRFLAILTVITKALKEYSDIFQAFTMSRGNELRLGKSDAPPSIFTCYLGEELESIVANLHENKGNAHFKKELNIGISNFAALTRDYSDTNRTAPCAFTGDKFEFRTLGSSATVAQPMAILNALIAKGFEAATVELKELLASNNNRDDAVIQLITNHYIASKDILYSGNSYSKEWQEKATKNNLFAPKNTLDAISILLDKERTQFLVDMDVLSHDEVMSRYRVRLEKYINKIEIELSILNEMSIEFIIPAVEKQLTSSIPVLENCTTDSLRESQKSRVSEIEEILEGLIVNSNALRDYVNSPVSKDGVDLKEVVEYIEATKPLVVKLREFADRAESIVSDEYWQIPKYRELLFSHRMR